MLRSSVPIGSARVPHIDHIEFNCGRENKRVFKGSPALIIIVNCGVFVYRIAR